MHVEDHSGEARLELLGPVDGQDSHETITIVVTHVEIFVDGAEFFVAECHGLSKAVGT